jgi:hypothetical protein
MKLEKNEVIRFIDIPQNLMAVLITACENNYSDEAVKFLEKMYLGANIPLEIHKDKK